MNFPIAYVLLKLGYPPHSVWYTRIIVNVFITTARLLYINKSMAFPLLLFVKKVLIPILYVTILSLPVPLALNLYVKGFWLNLITVIIVSLIVSILVVYMVGLNKNERKFALEILEKRIHVKIESK